MAKRLSGLGRGLDALFPSDFRKDDVINGVQSGGVSEISTTLITPMKDQPRTVFDEEKIAQMAQSIKEHGVLQPLVLVEKGFGEYQIIAGERRFRAAKKAGLKTVPAVIRTATDLQQLEIALVENIQREDLNPIEEAIAYKKLLVDFNLTQEEISRKISKSRTAITNCMRLLNLDERVQDYIIDEVISEGHGRAILGVSDKEIQYEIAQMVIDDSLNVRQTEKLVKNFDASKKEKAIKSENNIYYKDIVNKLENHFGTKVFINSKNKDKGKIEIEYYSEEEFERILEVLNI